MNGIKVKNITVMPMIEEDILIEEVRKRPVLYDKNLKPFDNSSGISRESAWVEIAEILNTKTDHCIKRWSYLRDYYLKSRKRNYLKGSLTENVLKRNRQLQFLDDYLTIRLRSKNLEMDDNSTNEFIDCSHITEVNPNSSVIDYCFDYDDIDEKSCNDNNFVEYTKINDDDDSKSLDFTNRKTETLLTSSNKRHPTIKANEHCSNMAEEGEHNCNNNASSVRNNHDISTFTDVIDLYFASMAATVKKFPYKKQIEAKFQFAQLLHKLELESYNESETAVKDK